MNEGQLKDFLFETLLKAGGVLDPGNPIIGSSKNTEKKFIFFEFRTVEETSAEAMSAEKVESIVNAKLEAFSKAVEGLAEMTKTIAETNRNLVNELTTLKSDFETFKAQPSNETKEAEKFSKVGNLTARQMFLKNSKV